MRASQCSLRRSTFFAAAFTAALASLLATALAQPIVGPVDEVTTVVTGRVSFEVDGVVHEHDVAATYYPADYGEDMVNETARRFMLAVAGSSTHHVTWNSMIMEVMGMRIVVSENLQVQVSAEGPAVDEGLERASIGFVFEWVDGGTEFTDAFVEEVLDQAE